MVSRAVRDNRAARMEPVCSQLHARIEALQASLPRCAVRETHGELCRAQSDNGLPAEGVRSRDAAAPACCSDATRSGRDERWSARMVQTDRRDRRAKLPLPSRRTVHRHHNGHPSSSVRRSAAWQNAERTSPHQLEHLTVRVRGGAAPQGVPSHRPAVGPSLRLSVCSHSRSSQLRSLLCSARLRSSFWRGEAETASSPRLR